MSTTNGFKMENKVLRLHFQDEGRPQIGSGHRYVRVKIGRRFVHMQDSERVPARGWKKFRRPVVEELWPQVLGIT